MAVRNILSSGAGVEFPRQPSVSSRGLRARRAARAKTGVSPYLTSPLKRAFDFGAAGLLVLLLLPVMVLAAIAVKWSSPGCIVFRQRRHGLRQASFEILKFRSMRAECGADASVPQVTFADPRVTSVGRFLRKTSIDELPQLINVLRGEMSLVGPRPHALIHDEKYLAELPSYAVRFAALPGITGLAQVSGARGETPTLAHMQRRLQFDLEYIRTASLLLDLKILILTALALITRRGNAY
ncbi:sugar transferase [Microvirga sp. 2TAF3]|uniref:sugar transferase n=1 Tax=Microvirga sp. 2TAF3 TaxID=3233014 RepID=UPI003F9D1C66